MNPAEYLKILRDQDVAIDQRSQKELVEAWEKGEGKKEDERLFKLALAISATIGGIEKIEMGSLLQDANYWAEIEMTVSRWEKPSGVVFVGKKYFGNPGPNMTIYSKTQASMGGRLSIRFSSEGNFVAIIDEQNALNVEQTEKLTKIFSDNGYLFIPMKVLEAEYDGVREIVGEKWFDRFFDY
jgi:hypothetical protein